MSDEPRVSPDDLRAIPLLRGFTDGQLARIIDVFERVPPDREVLFEAGELAEEFYVLTGGSVSLEPVGGIEVYQLHPIAVIGELGGLTGRPRNSRAAVAPDSEVWRVAINRLLELFDADKDIGLGFQQNLMHIVAEKIARDQIRLQDMRRNIVRTQRAMKKMRDLLLESQDTVISDPLHATIEALITQNRRVNYRVEPPSSMAALVRFDDGSDAPVTQISRTHVSYRLDGAAAPADGDRVSAVLRLRGPEIPMTGVVLRVVEGRVDLELDLMVDEYVNILEGYLTRVQMLDFLV